MLDPRLALATLIVIPFMVIASALFRSRSARAYSSVRERLGLVTATLAEDISGMRMVQAFVREQRATENFRSVARDYRDSNMQTVVLNGLYFPFVSLLATLALAVVLGYGGHLYLNDAIALTTLFAFMLYVNNFFDPIQQLSQLYNTFLSAAAALDKIIGVLDEEPDVVDQPGAQPLAHIEGHVRFEDVHFAYGRGSRGAARDRPRRPGGDDGRARRPHRRRQVDDREAPRAVLRADERPDHDRRRRPQRRDAGVAAPPARDRAAGGLPLRRHRRREHRLRPGPTRGPEDIVRAAQTVGAHEFILRLEDGYETQLGERGSRLSLGQRQLVAFARALLADPRILILDEATSSVDIGTERTIERALRTLLADRTSFVIAHRLSTIRDADLIVVLEHGQVIEQGSHDELLARRGLYTSLYGDWAAA